MSGRSSRGWLWVAALVAALVLPVVVAGALWWWQQDRLSDAEATVDADRAALDAATRETLAWATVDYREVDEYIERVRSSATGRFLAQWEEREEALRALLGELEPVQVPTIPKDGAGLICGAAEKCDEGDAQALIAMDATVTNKNTKQPVPRQYRIKVTLEESGEDWLVENLEYIDAQA